MTRISIAKDRYTVVIHGKPGHEETRATFSHIAQNTPALIIKDMEQARLLAGFILGNRNSGEFNALFGDQCSGGFDVTRDLERIGIVNQTTMLASDTQAISDFLKKTIQDKNQLNDKTLPGRFADTRDTLCYATHDNQQAVYRLLEESAHLAIVAGGYNSSNTSHLVELCEQKLPTYYIESAEKIISRDRIVHYLIHEKKESQSVQFIPPQQPVIIAMSSGASCPDVVVENIILKIISFFKTTKTPDDVLNEIIKK